MMGPKTARTIRKQLATALARTGKDPIQWLEERIRRLEKQRKPEPGELDVLQSLCRVLKGAKKSRPQRRRVKAQSSR